MKKRLQLQQYLDSQLEKIEQRDKKQDELSQFDHLEQKLLRIQEKLISLKNGKLNFSNLQHEEQKKSQNYPNNLFQSSKKKKQRQKEQENGQENQVTPQKKLNLISKTMSEKYFTSYKSHRKINRKKFESEARTAKEADNYSTYKFKTAKNATVKKQKENITEPKTYSRPKILSSTQNINQKQEKSLLVIQKEIKNCLKSNGQLRAKIDKLQNYKSKYCKLRDVFYKLEMRRKKVFS